MCQPIPASPSKRIDSGVNTSTPKQRDKNQVRSPTACATRTHAGRLRLVELLEPSAIALNLIEVDRLTATHDIQMIAPASPAVVIVGAGFGGLNAAQALAKAPVQITVIDRKNYPHLPAAALPGGDRRDSLRERSPRPSARFFARTKISKCSWPRSPDSISSAAPSMTSEADIPYDYLIVAAGASHAYFGHDDWEPYAPGLKTIEDALEIRRRVLLAFELAERQAAAGETATPLNFVVVGGGPTGVELAGTLAEIARHALAHEFRSIDPARTHILLIEGGPRVLPAYAEDLSRSAQEQLNRLGVEVRTSTTVTQIEPGAVVCGKHASAGDGDPVGSGSGGLPARQEARRAGRSRRPRAGATRSQHCRPSGSICDRRPRRSER